MQLPSFILPDFVQNQKPLEDAFLHTNKTDIPTNKMAAIQITKQLYMLTLIYSSIHAYSFKQGSSKNF